MKLLFENKRYILSIFLTPLMVFCTLISGYADENSDPVFIDGNRATRTIAENTAAGVNIGKPIAATDADNDVLTYNKGWLEGAGFSIDTATGQIRTKDPLDYETKNVYTFSVFANDGNGGRDIIIVTINVTDVDETPTNNAPTFTDGTSTTRTVAENTAAGRNIGTAIAATDADNDTLTYSLGGTDAAAFSIVSTSGQLQTKAALDYETDASYAVSVSVSDDNGESDSISVTISVTDVNETPSFPTETATRSIAENTAAGQAFGDPFQATDPDSGDTLTYSLHRGDRYSFRIDSTTGQLRTHASLNFETKKVYNNLAIRATDSKGNFDAIFVTINVTNVNETPSFPTETATRFVAENTASGQAFGDPFQATDPDSGDTLTYSLHRGDAGVFRINPITGQLRTHRALDFEAKKVYNNLAIRATDSNGKFDAIFVTINVTNVNEAPSFTDGSSTTQSIAENTASGTNIGTAIAATDPDTDDTLTYTLSGTDASSFSIVSTSGQLQTKAALDYETKTSYSVSVSVSDGNGGSDSITVSINVTDVNENRAPTFTDGDSTTRSIAENTAAGVNIGSAVSATDADDDTLTYTLGGTDASSFSIISTSGQLQTKVALNFESKTSYSVTVTASDSSLTDSIPVTISVTDVNETPSFPTETATRSIAENTASGEAFGDPFQATDPDSGDTLTYSLHRGDAGVFRINPSTGQLRTHAPLDFETKKIYNNLAIRATDSNGKFDAIFVTINVTDVNENRAPAFSEGNSTTRSIAENTASGVNIGSAVSATDADTEDTLTYTLGGTDASSFSIVSTSGQLRTSTALDYETKTSYSVTVSVSDGNGGSDSITVTINVTDVTEITPPLSDRTPQVRDGIVAAVPGVSNANDVTEAQLAAITSLNLSSKSISSLKAGDFNGLTALSTLDLSSNSISDISTLEGLTALTELRLHINSISDISALENLTALSTLDLSSNSISNISALENLTSLTNLYLNNISISDISALEDLTALTWLDLGWNSISDISALEDLTSLATLFLNNNSISNISALEDLTALTKLVLGWNSIRNISALEDLTALTELYLFRNSISDISTLEDLTALTKLDLHINSISDISALEDLTALTKLDLGWNSISNISALEDLTSLTTLFLNNNSISNISILEDLTALTELYLFHNSISDISALENLTALTWLELFSNSISDISALENLTALTELNLNNNSISDISILEDLTALTKLYLSRNSISDYGPLRRLKAAIEVIEGHPGLTLDITIPAVSNSNVPVFSDGATTTRSIAENTDSGTNIGSPVAATDADAGDILTYHLGGTDADAFSIVRASGQLQTKAELDYETKNAYTVAIAVSDGKGGSDTITVTINVTDVVNENVGAAPSAQTSPVIPDNTVLLSNFPNPFNPETWIPYQLAKPADVTLTIYDIRGRVVRTLRLGYQPAGLYRSRSKAVHWDGRNQFGEKVATGVYFYTLKAGDYMATRKLLIRK